MNKTDILYVGFQLLLFILFVMSNNNNSIGLHLSVIGLTLSVLGLLIIIISLLQLNKSLSPFPSPKKGSKLVISGLYSIVRHPIYFGILTMFLGYSLYCDNWSQLLITFVLAILFHFKSEYEEKMLLQKFPSYKAYKKSTSKIIPFF